MSWLHCSEGDGTSCPFPVQPTQSHVQETQDTRQTNPSSPQPVGPSITLITAEGIPNPWRNELGVFPASCFTECLYSIALQLQGAVMG